MVAHRRCAALQGRRSLCTIAVVPFLAWIAWSEAQPEEAARQLGLHIQRQRLQNAYGVVARWLFPEPIPSVIRLPIFTLVLLGTLVAGVLVARRFGTRRLRDDASALPPCVLAAAAFGVAFAVVWLVTAWFLDPVLRGDTRQFSPSLVAAIIVVAALSERVQDARARGLLVGGAALIILLNAITTVARRDRHNGAAIATTRPPR